MPILDFNWSQFLLDLFKVIAAFLLALPVAWERERTTRIMGLRTFPLVAVASCGFVLVALAFLGAETEPQARIIQGLMTGMGFIGGGAILKGDRGVQGTATAASIWTTGVVGAAVAYGRYEIAIIISIINFLVLQTLTPLKEVIHSPEVASEAEDDEQA